MPSTPEQDEKRRQEAPWRRWYWTPAWSRIRFRRLHNEPLCRMCKANKLLNDGSKNPDGTLVTDPKRRKLFVDHVIPHRGNYELFFDYENTQSLCGEHHDKWKQAAEKSKSEARGVDGWPVEAG